jgi:hypothetical protein
LKGYKVGDKTFKTHLDGYNFVPYFKGEVAEGPRHEFFYFSDNADLMAMRYNDWKIAFKTIQGNLFTGKEDSTNVPWVTNLRMDPWERYQSESDMYTRWWGDQLWTLVPSVAIVGQFLQSFKEYPPSQVSGSNSVTRFLEAISAGVSALWGPAHGGANEAVLAMLEQIGTVANIPKFLGMAKDKSSHFRLMGFGHRVYKNFDPRAKIIRETCHTVLAKLGRTDNPLFELALRLEEIALQDEYFIERKLYPNVDFYSGIIYSALGIPRSMFTVMFAIARTVGWVAHWLEMIADPGMRISRPRQLYTGATRRDYVPVALRSRS